MTADIAILAVLAVLAVLALWLCRRTEGLGKVRAASYGAVGINRELLPFWVQLVSVKSGEPICGGVLIGKDVVLTAAHCLLTSKLDDFYCTIGDDNTIPAGTPGSRIEYRFPKTIRLHENYDDSSNAYDVGLVFLDKPVEASPVQLWTSPGSQSIAESLHRDPSSVKIAGRGWAESITAGVHEYRPDGKKSTVKKYIELVFGKDYFDSYNFKNNGSQELVSPFELLTNTEPVVSVADTQKKQYSQLAVTTRGGILKGDSGSALLIKKDNQWHVAGVVSHTSFANGDNISFVVDASGQFEDTSMVYERVADHIEWIGSTIATIDEIKSKLLKESITIHEIAHVVALARLKQLKALAKSKNTTFDKLFLTSKNKWLNLADYFNANKSRYGDLGSSEESQLAVLWALVSSYDNFQVLLEMVSESENAVNGIPYFLRLGYSSTGSEIASVEHGALLSSVEHGALLSSDFVSRHGVLQKFETVNAGGETAWSADGSPLHWKPTDEKDWADAKKTRYYEATKDELAKENEHKKKRKAGFKYLEARPLRRRMFCDFVDTLSEYLKTRPLWYKKYLHYNNISSPTRTYGLYECIEPNEDLYYDDNTRIKIVHGEEVCCSNPKTSYGPSAQKCSTRGFPFPFHRSQNRFQDSSAFLSEFVKSRMRVQPVVAQADASRAWLDQVSGDHWPELTATTLYDRYEWIEMPKGYARSKITFREAMFLITEDERFQLINGIKGVDPMNPSADDGSWKATRGFGHPGTNNILRYNCSSLMYFYLTIGNKMQTSAGRNMVLSFMMREKTRFVFKTDEKWNPYDINDDVIITKENYVYKGKVKEFTNVKLPDIASRKQHRPLGSQHIALEDLWQKMATNDYEQFQIEVKAFLDSNVDLQPIIPYYVEYSYTDDDFKVLFAKTVEMQPIGIKMNPRFAKAASASLPECTPKTSQPPAPPPPPSNQPSEDEDKQVQEVYEQIASQLKILGPCPKN